MYTSPVQEVGSLRRALQERRILIFAHDGRGLGHLKRLSRIAAVLQQKDAVLIITGHRSASWLVPQECEYVHIPSLDSIDNRRSRLWGREPFWRGAGVAGRQLRSDIVLATVQSFKPEAIILDYLPMGRDEEMFDILDRASDCRKYFITRGILDTAEKVEKLILTPKGKYLLEERYDRIFIAADRQIVGDVVTEYGFTDAMQHKTHWVGYVADRVDQEMRLACRGRRGVPDQAKWVVCSAGGGRGGEDLTLACQSLVARFPDVYFDIIVGPRSTLALSEGQCCEGNRVRLSREEPNLWVWHASCDVMISLGGYNSLLEGIMGSAAMITMPIKNDMEQFENARRFGRLRPLQLLATPEGLEAALERALDDSPVSLRVEQFLNINGAENIARLIKRDFRIGSKMTAEELAVSSA